VIPTHRHIPGLVLGLALLSSPSPARAQNSLGIADLMMLSRGSAMGGQALAGDLLAAGIDPTVASGPAPAVELAAGTHALGLEWAAAGTRIRAFGRPLALVFGSLSYGEQQRTGFDDRLGVFSGTFTPMDAALSAATLLLDEGTMHLGLGTTLAFTRIDEATALTLSGALAVRHRQGPFELRGGLSNVGAVLSPFDSGTGTRLAPRVRAGGAWSPEASPYGFSGELQWRSGDRRLLWGIGGEWWPVPEAALRLGFTRGDGIAATADGGLGKVGMAVGASGQHGDWRLTYSWRPGGLLGDGHLLGLGWRLGPLR
jgi:hypothetical protein